jgi:hypothetical protein
MAKAKKTARPLNPRLLRDLTCDRPPIVGRNPRVCRMCSGAGTLFDVPAKLFECPVCNGMAIEWSRPNVIQRSQEAE